MWSIATAVFVIFLVHPNFAQENAGTNIAPALVECYNNTRLLTRDNRLPQHINALIDLIRKLEDRHPNLNAREISAQILHRFRQDGIRRDRRDVDSSVGLPYSPKGFQTYKNRVLLKKLIPALPITMDNNTLNDVERCSLHYMISNSIESQLRDNEANECSKIARYTSRVHKRDTELAEQNMQIEISNCPIESGVVYTKWGAVSAGDVLAGLAAGIQSQPIRLSTGTVESIYASSLAGELSEAALYESTVDKVIGNKGGWNSTLVPKYYFLENNQLNNLYLTDAEIRGGLDGLFLGLSYQNSKSKASNIKISQLLDLYYSPRGVFNQSIRACNRNALVNDLTTSDKLIEQTSNFNYLLDEEAQYSYTPNKNSFPDFARKSVNSFNSYVANLNDLACTTEDETVERAATDIIIFVDTDWDFTTILAAIGYTLDSINVNKFESSYTIYDGSDCDLIVNKSRTVLDFHERFNRSQYNTYRKGFDYKKVVQLAENIVREKLNNETDVLQGQSTIVLLMPRSTPNDDEKKYIRDRRVDVFRSYIPDLRIMVVGSDSRDAYSDLVYNPTTDIVTLQTGTDDNGIKDSINSLTERIRKLPRSVINPACKVTFTAGISDFEITQYVEPNGINYHKISPHYFRNGDDNRLLKVQGQGYGRLSVCTSRTEPNPRGNTTDIECTNINSDEYSVKINNYCSGNVLDCNPIYVSVEGINSNIRCTDALCRFPDSIKYTVRIERAGCASSAKKLFGSFAIISILFFILRF